MKKNSTYLLAVILALSLGILIGRRNAPNNPESKIIRDTVTCTIYDTIVREKPVYRYSYITDTVRTYFTTVEHDSVFVEVPIETFNPVKVVLDLLRPAHQA